VLNSEAHYTHSCPRKAVPCRSKQPLGNGITDAAQLGPLPQRCTWLVLTRLFRFDGSQAREAQKKIQQLQDQPGR
jgi:hypothetical protein